MRGERTGSIFGRRWSHSLFIPTRFFLYIFRENAHRLYHWAHDRSIPADNNFAERELRQLVIHNQRGAIIRGHLLSRQRRSTSTRK